MPWDPWLSGFTSSPLPSGTPLDSAKKTSPKKIEVLLGMLIEINGGFSSKPLLTIGTPILANIYSFIIH